MCRYFVSKIDVMLYLVVESEDVVVDADVVELEEPLGGAEHVKHVVGGGLVLVSGVPYLCACCVVM